MYLHQRWGFACVCVVGEGGQQQLPEAFIMHAGVICMSFVDLRGCYNVHLSCWMFQMPSQYDCGPVKSDKGWHIPYDDGTSSPQSTSQSVLCLQYKGQRASPQRVKKQTASD